jgi:hypothetical protein
MKERANLWHVAYFMLTSVLAGFLCGYVLSYTNNASPVLQAKYGWVTKHE